MSFDIVDPHPINGKMTTMTKLNRPVIIRTHDPKADTLTCENVGTRSTSDDPQRYNTLVFTGVSLMTDADRWNAIGKELTIQAQNGALRKGGDDWLKATKTIRIPASSPGAKIETPETRKVAVDRAVASCDTVKEAEAMALAFKQRHEQLLAMEKSTR